MEPDSSEELDIRILAPGLLRLFQTDGDVRVRLTVEGDRSYLSVKVARAFPFSDPAHYVGFRDGADKDIGMVEDPRELDAASRAVVDAEMARRYFTPKAERVISVKEEHGTVIWQLETDRGPRRFVVRNIRDNAAPIGPGRIVLTDGEGNRIEFFDPIQYGPKAYDILSKVI